MRMLYIVVIIVALALSLTTDAQETGSLHLMPWPASAKTTPSSQPLIIQISFLVGLGNASDPALRRTIEIFLNDLRRHTGSMPLDFEVSNEKDVPAQLKVKSEHPSKPVQELGEDESYALQVTSSGAELNAPTTLGVMRGLQTFLQLVEITPQGFAVPAVVIEDTPRFPWRGLMIDSGRHFMPLDVLKRNLDGMEAVKMNVFHWHLSENQGFRAESRKFPKLHEQGSDGLFYTQEEIREVVEYARDRGIRMVPEFDMPGHSTAWFAGYPELASGSGPYAIERKWGVFDPAMDPASENTYKFLDELIAEMAKLFPDNYFHIGGDRSE